MKQKTEIDSLSELFPVKYKKLLKKIFSCGLLLTCPNVRFIDPIKNNGACGLAFMFPHLTQYDNDLYKDSLINAMKNKLKAEKIEDSVRLIDIIYEILEFKVDDKKIAKFKNQAMENKKLYFLRVLVTNEKAELKVVK